MNPHKKKKKREAYHLWGIQNNKIVSNVYQVLLIEFLCQVNGVWVTNVVLALNQANLQATCLQIVVCCCVVTYSSPKYSLQNQWNIRFSSTTTISSLSPYRVVYHLQSKSMKSVWKKQVPANLTLQAPLPYRGYRDVSGQMNTKMKYNVIRTRQNWLRSNGNSSVSSRIGRD